MNNQHNNASILTRLLWLLAVMLLPQAMSAQTEYKLNISEATDIIGETGTSSTTGITGFTLDDFTVSCAKGTGSNPPRLGVGASFRLYAGNTVTFTAPSGELFTQISLTCNSIKGSMTSDTGGTETDTAGKQIIWSAQTPVRSVTFTGATSANIQISEFVFVTDTDPNGGGGDEPDPGPEPGSVAAPTLTPAPGVYYSTQYVTAESAGNYIYYTTDGNDPKEQWSYYSNSCTITVNRDCQVRVVAQDPNTGEWSEETTGVYTIVNLPTPTITPNGGYFADPQRVTISAHAGYTVRYTLDGEEPTENNGIIYTSAFMIEEGCVIKAACFDGEGHRGNIAEAVFTYSKPGIGEGGYNPNSPADPSAPELARKYRLIKNFDPAGVDNATSSWVTAGESTYVNAYSKTGWVFDGWWRNGEQVGTDRYYSFTMPEEDVVMTARYHYDPNSPSDPSEAKLQHPLTVTASPAKAGSFNFTTVSVTEGEITDIWAYPSTNWEFTGWEIDGEPSSGTSSRINVTMGQKPINVVGKFRYNPSSPVSPGENYWNANTGQMIIDHFTPGRAYDVASSLAGSGNLGNVGSLILKGEIYTSDIAVGNNLPNVDVLDFSRTAGLTEVPTRNFQNSSASTISLPACISSFGSYVFTGAQNLVSLSLHSTVPPTTYTATFSGFDRSNCVLRVPKESIDLYVGNDAWASFAMILPLAEEVHTLKVNLPEGYLDGRLKGYRLELVNERSGARQKYVVTDRPFYTFSGLMEQEQFTVFLSSQQGLTVGKIEGILMPASDFEATFDRLKEVKEASVKVLTPDGTDVTASTTIEWYEPKADGTETYLRKTDRLGEVPVGQLLKVKVTPGDLLAEIYETPEELLFTLTETETSTTVMLSKIREVTVKGEITDGNGSPLKGAVITALQNLNNRVSKTVSTQSDENGQWTMEILAIAGSQIVYSATDCVNLTEKIDEIPAEAREIDLGVKALRSIVGAKIPYGFTYYEPGTDDIQNYYSDYKNVLLSVYNITQDRNHSDISQQFPILAVLDENINPGDELRITASSKTGAFLPVEKTVIVTEGMSPEIIFDLIGKGCVISSYKTTDNRNVTALLYDVNGSLVKSSDYTSNTVTFQRLSEGEYSIVSIGKSSLIGSAQNISLLKEIGLEAGTDYILDTFTVENGKVTEIANESIPSFDESLFTYTGQKTGFSANKSSITTGNYLTLRANIDFKKAYAGDINNVSLVVDLPENCDLVDQSVIFGATLIPYTVEGRRVTVSLGDNYSSQLRFCVIPTIGGDFNATANVQFNYNGNILTQPIGNVRTEVKDLEIIVPKTIASSSFKVSGTATAKSDIRIYDGNILIGSGTSNGYGNWTVQCALNEDANLGRHNIHAEIYNHAHGTTLTTESKPLVYDKNAVMVSKVVMYHDNPEMSTTYEMVFDFMNPNPVPQKYTYYIYNKTFTFTIDFNTDDPEAVSNVILWVKTGQGRQIPLEPFFDEKRGCWVAVGEFGNMYDGDIPVNVSLDYDIMTNSPVSRSEISGTEIDYDVLKSENASLEESFDNLRGMMSEMTDEEFETRLNDLTGFTGETGDTDYSGLSPEELLEKVNELAKASDSLAESIDPALAEFASMGKYGTFDLSEYGEEGTLEISSTEGMSPDELLEAGFEAITVDDGTIIYQLIEEGRYEYVDFAADIHTVMTYMSSDRSSAMKKAAGIDRLRNLIDTFQGKIGTLMGYVSKINEGIAYIPTFFEMTINGFEAAIEDNREAYKGLQKLIAGSDDLDYNMRLQEEVTMLKGKNIELGKKIATWKNNFGLVMEVISKVTAVVGAFCDAYAMGSNATEYINLWYSVPYCPCDPARTDLLKDDILASGVRIAVKDLANIGGDLFTIHSLFGAVSAAVPTGGTSLIYGVASVGLNLVKGKLCDWLDSQAEKERAIFRKRISSLEKDKSCYNCPDPDPNNPNPTNPNPNDPKPGNGTGGAYPSGSADGDPSIDPSGFVYEGVPSNRLEGVQATCYYREEVEDMYGDKELRVVLWNAEEYAQENPLFTDENGMYRWDVPQGEWQVKFEKDGYVTTYSDWLPVPPPQLEVNIAMTQNSQPEVESVRAYADGVEITFDKYMDPETLTTANIYVTASGKRLSGAIEMIDAEVGDAFASADDGAKQYARTVRFVPEQSLSTSEGEITLFIRSDVRSYAGIPMTEAFSQTFDIEKEVKEIVAESDLIKVLYGGEKEIVISALPYDAAVGRTLRVANTSPMIASVETEEVTLDENGQATIRVHGELPGTAGLTFTIDDVRVTGSGTLNVVTELIEAVAPRASRASGTAVYRGTKVELVSETEDAEIYFTTDGSCPCDADGTRRRYSVPFVIDGDLQIKAIAVVQNEESPVAEFSYTLKRTAVSPSTEEGWNWISHNLESEVAVGDVAGENVDVIKGQETESVRDPHLGLVGGITTLAPARGYKLHTTERGDAPRLEDVAYNPSTPFELHSGWNWIGYPLDQTMSLDEAFAPTEVEAEDYVVGQNGFAIYDGESWTGELSTLNPGQGYMYYSNSDKELTYNTSIVSKANALHVTSALRTAPWMADRRKYADAMPVIAELVTASGGVADADAYFVGAFCGSECRGVGRWIDGRLMMNVWGRPGDELTFRIADAFDAEAEEMESSTVIGFTPVMTGSLAEPLQIRMGGMTGIGSVRGDSPFGLQTEGDILRVSGPTERISEISLYTTDGMKVLSAASLPDGTLSLEGLHPGVHVVAIVADENYSYYKIVVK